MAGTTTVPTAAAASSPQFLNYIRQQHELQMSANSFSLVTVCNRLAILLRNSGAVNLNEFYSLCLALARHIDYALVNNEVPCMAKQLPGLLKQICVHRRNVVVQTCIMVLMVTVKNACVAGWFPENESRALLGIANEIASVFCSPRDLISAANYSSISKILARFYPLMSMGKLIASMEVKPGYGAYVMDFHISKNIEHSLQNSIRLFVAQTDNIDTSACIISPQQVNFLINGNSIERRTNIFMDCGPQMPTDVTSLLKCGTNLLQAVGQFNGNYSILVTFMSVKSPASPMIADYVQDDVATQDLDSDIVEGPSRISLNCPISYARVKTPVKGHSCKHLQCFDFDNYVNINSRRPSWRCPHCNHPVSYADIRLDGNMAKVLREVGDSVADVIISADGSWKSVLESDDHVSDLTGDDNVMSGSEDRKPAIDQVSMASVSNNEAGVNHSAVPPINNDFLQSFTTSIDTSGNLLSWDAIYSALNSGAEGINNIPKNSLVLNQRAAAIMQLQQLQLMNPALNHEYRRLAATLASPVPSWTPSTQPPQQITRSSLSNPVPKAQASFTQASTPSQQHRSPIQNWNQGQQARSSLAPGAYRAENQTLHQQQALNIWGTSPGWAQPYTQVMGIPVQGGTPWAPMQHCVQTAGQHNRYTLAPRQPTSRNFQPASAPGQTSGTGMSNPVNADTVRTVMPTTNPASDEIRMPAGRMRGSLAGCNYSPSVSQLIIQPTDPNLPTEPVTIQQPKLFSTAVPSLEAVLEKTKAGNNLQSQN